MRRKITGITCMCGRLRVLCQSPAQDNVTGISRLAGLHESPGLGTLSDDRYRPGLRRAGHSAGARCRHHVCLAWRAWPARSTAGSARRGPGPGAAPACTRPGAPRAARHRRVRRPRGGGAGPGPRWTESRTPRHARTRPAHAAPSTVGARRRPRPAPRLAVTTADGPVAHRPAQRPAKDTKSCSVHQGACPAAGLLAARHRGGQPGAARPAAPAVRACWRRTWCASCGPTFR
jgi:hypothetical protein